MARVALTSGAYQARSVIASAQRCLNLYPEALPQEAGEPMPASHYPTPGLRLLRYLPELPVRAVRQAANGKIYIVAGKGVYRVTPPAGIAGWDYTHLGDITPGRTTPASMMDNGFDLVIVDGSTNGWTVTIADDVFAPIVDPSGLFVGADRVDFIDTFFVFNRPGTNEFYWSLSLQAAFDPLGLDIASKNSVSDLLVTAVVAKREIFLLGERTTEIWSDVGEADSQFAQVQGTFIDHGCAAKYSAASRDNTIFWLSRDRAGKGSVMMAAGYEATTISTPAIEVEIGKYARIDDAFGFVYQLSGHAFYALTFPTADHTWVYDVTTKQWHEWAFIDQNGNEHAHRAMCVYPCFGILLAGDRQYGNLYQLDSNTYTDWGFPISRVRSFPHIVAEGRRVFYRELILDVDAGIGPDTTDTNIVSLSWSDDRGHSYGNPVMQSLGGQGEYLTSVQFQRLGVARDRVFRVQWTVEAPVALQGCWLTVELADADQPAPKKQEKQAV